MVRSRIIGTGSYVPQRVVSNREAGALLEVDPATISRLTGIQERRWAGTDQASSDLAVEAARTALQAAGLHARAVDAIVVSTTSPDMAFPSTACHVQRKLACAGVPAFDVAASCSGFLYGLSMADAMIRSGQIKTCLVAAAEIKSRTLDPHDMDTAFLFGDGAGAVIVQGEWEESQPSRGLLGIRLAADGSRHDLIRIDAGGSRRPSNLATLKASSHTLRMQGAPLFRLAVKRLEQAIRNIVKEFGIELRDVAQFVVHQANGRILSQLASRLSIPPDRICSVIERYGNTSSASLPIALDHAVKAGKVKPHDLMVLGSFGGGLTWASGLVRW
ncbi:MAG TPA: beta-ketoacyl-ACP synthase III [Nitrospira sp.]|nr:beta-ketoacyl-ACP synthase III [Nitrospira sp.]